MNHIYKIKRNPTDKKWYVIGNCGGGYWMPVSNAFDTHAEAEKHMAKQHLADIDARRCIGAI